MGDSVFFPIRAKDETKDAFASVNKRLKGMSDSMLTLNQGAELVGKAFRKIKFATEFFARRAKEFDDLAKSANRLGTTSSQLDRLSHAADLAGANLQDMETILKRGQRQIFDAATGVQSAAEAFEHMGIEVRDSGGKIKTAQQVMFEFSDKMQGLASETEKTALAMEIFGRSGQQMIPFFRIGSDAIKDQLVEAELLATRYYEMTKQGEDFVDMQVRMKRVTRAWGDEIANWTLPWLNELMGEIVEFTQMVRNEDVGVEFAEQLARMSLEGSKALPDIRALKDNVQSELADLNKFFDENPVNVTEFLGTQLFKDATDEQIENYKRRKKLQAQNAALIEAERAAEKSWIKEQKENILARKEIREEIDRILAEGIAADDMIMRGGIGKKQIEDLKQDLMDLPDDIKNSFTEALPDGIYPLILPPNTQFDDIAGRFAQVLNEEFFGVGETFRNTFSDVFADMIVENQKLTDAVTEAWQLALNQIAKQIMSNLIFRGLGALFGGGAFSFLGGGIFGGLFGGSAFSGGTLGGSNQTATVAPGANTFIFNGLTTTSQAEQVRTTTELDRARADTAYLRAGS